MFDADYKCFLMARGQGWEPGEEAETDLERREETGGLRRETELTSEPGDRTERGRLGTSPHKYSQPGIHSTHAANCHHYMQLGLLWILQQVSQQLR